MINITSLKLDNKINKFSKNDPKLIKSTFLQAKEYHLASTILTKQHEANFEGEKIYLISSSYSLAAFSCELYLKTILLLYGKDAHGHKLLELYSKLPEVEKIKIIKFFEVYDLSQEKFTKELEDISQAFVVIRYSNELKSIAFNGKFLAYFLNILFKICKEEINNIK